MPEAVAAATPDAATAAPGAAPAPTEPAETEVAVLPTAQWYYIVNSRDGAPAFAGPVADGSPIYTFADAAELTVLDTTPDKRWLKVQIPHAKATGYVSSTIVTTGFRLPK